jgi:hypothetical protein
MLVENRQTMIKNGYIHFGSVWSRCMWLWAVHTNKYQVLCIQTKIEKKGNYGKNVVSVKRQKGMDHISG